MCARAESLDAIFARMDKAAKEFKSATASLKQVEYTAVIDEKTTEDGVLHLKRVHGNVMLRVNFDPPNQRVVALNGHLVVIYYPQAKSADKYDVSKYTSKNTVEQLLLLSFGAASGTELKKDYTVTGGQTEKIDSTVTTRVELVPKSEEMRNAIRRITLWIPEGKRYALKERVDKPGKDYIEWTYMHPELNKPLPDSEVTLKLPPGVHVAGGEIGRWDEKRHPALGEVGDGSPPSPAGLAYQIDRNRPAAPVTAGIHPDFFTQTRLQAAVGCAAADLLGGRTRFFGAGAAQVGAAGAVGKRGAVIGEALAQLLGGELARAGKISSAEIGHGDLGLAETRSGKGGASEIAAADAGFPEIAVVQIGVAEDALDQLAAREISAAEHGAGEVAVIDFRSAEAGR